jgi:hypothetical protein
MDEKRIPKRVFEWKPTGRRIRGRPRKRWVDRRRYPDVRNKRVEKAEYGKDGMEEDH